MTLDAILKRIDRYIHAAKRQAEQPLARLPYVVKTYDAPPGLPSDFVVRQIENGALPLRDMPGYEQSNQEVEQQWRGSRIRPKVYLNFDPASDGADLEPDEQVAIAATQAHEVVFREWLEGLPGSSSPLVD